MPKTFNLNITAPDKAIFDGKVASLIVPSALGYLGVLADHTPLMANLVSGKIVFRDDAGKTQTLHSVGEGIIEVLKNNVSVLLHQSQLF